MLPHLYKMKMFEKYFLCCHWGHDNAAGASKLELRQIRLLYYILETSLFFYL